MFLMLVWKCSPLVSSTSICSARCDHVGGSLTPKCNFFFSLWCWCRAFPMWTCSSRCCSWLLRNTLTSWSRAWRQVSSQIEEGGFAYRNLPEFLSGGSWETAEMFQISLFWNKFQQGITFIQVVDLSKLWTAVKDALMGNVWQPE